MALRPCSGWPVCCKAINLDFLASFSLVHFFWTWKRNEHKRSEAAYKDRPKAKTSRFQDNLGDF